MTRAARHRFDVDALRNLAGDKVFARGEAYHRDGQVQILFIEPQRLSARVTGTEDYRTELTGRGTTIGGSCSCPAFGDWGFCKHMVATALQANEAGAEAEGDGMLARIRDHLKGKSIDALVAMIMDLAERDPVLFRKLEIAATVTHADDKTIEARLGKAIDSATRTRDFVDYHEAAEWAEGVDTALAAVAELASGEHAAMALRLAERAIDRIGRAIESIDDSDGHCGVLLDRARDIHLAAAHMARPEPLPFARALFARETTDEYDTFDGAAALYADVLGEEGLSEYRRLAIAAWKELPPRRSRDGRDAAGNYHRLAGILDFFAERDGDVAARIALRAKDLSSPGHYLQLAEFCLAQGRQEEALRRAEEGLWMFEDDRPDERLVFFTADLLVKLDRNSDAEAHLWRAFEKTPSFELYRRLRKAGGDEARDRALGLLEARVAWGKRDGWHDPGDLLIRILMQEKRFDAAWALVRTRGASSSLKEKLARASEATHAAAALQIYTQRVDQLAEGGGNAAYAEAVALVARMAALRDTAEQTAYVAALKTRFGRKRNLMKLLG